MDISITDLVPVDNELKKLAAQTPTFVNGIGACECGPVHLLTQGNDVLLLGRLPHLRLTTYWTVKPPARRGDKPKQIPVFHSGANAVRLSPVWAPPHGMALWFVMAAGQGRGPIDRPVATSAFLLATCYTGAAKSGGTFKLPLPNLHENGRVCMGSGNEPSEIQRRDASVPLPAIFNAALSVFLGNPWNADMLSSNDISLTHAMFSFAEDGKTPVPPPEDWYLRMSKISNSLYNNVPFKELCS